MLFVRKDTKQLSLSQGTSGVIIRMVRFCLRQSSGGEVGKLNFTWEIVQASLRGNFTFAIAKTSLIRLKYIGRNIEKRKDI